MTIINLVGIVLIVFVVNRNGRCDLLSGLACIKNQKQVELVFGFFLPKIS
ncbi:hypothetical protein HMPREF0496_2086 [Lentilactobacillus hilgardii ATCC 27305]|uniref:Uncharacterized protein n=1 Tax=Lentilactobacillus hilgardii (strain ATCC 8290 / DSM 20176 / CCUG 30140 / JCM 1155 / KCTC 3500 / NBRC 15886 / NCIMB 8040 / NRRL B-1843 / 9) TaxID=1423757 RepID=C0XHI2_LENH9|nr:hypothetical protein HMPREF0519_0693 [Lentilactobacillus hilgardii DSM 20176 = ATCC 8290]EEI70596.1 hypothetical protein HMPREF0496_2086 [Lentilactobacillus hilgardii ATCC 27305]